MPELDLNRPLRHRVSGANVRYLATIDDATLPNVFALETDNGDVLMRLTETFAPMHNGECLIENVPVIDERWQNLYPTTGKKVKPRIHLTREAADRLARPHRARIARIIYEDGVPVNAEILNA